FMKPPPPMFPAVGYVTASANPVATAASTALPPALRISTPASLARRELLTTIACSASVAGAPARKRHPSGNATRVASLEGAPAGAAAAAGETVGCGRHAATANSADSAKAHERCMESRM